MFVKHRAPAVSLQLNPDTMMKIRHALALTCLATLLPLGITAADDDDKRDKDRD